MSADKRKRFLVWLGVTSLLTLGLQSKTVAITYMDSFTLKNCNKENVRCVSVTGKKAEGSDLAPLFYFKNAEVSIQDISKSTILFTNVEGYFDLSMGRLLFVEKQLTKDIENVIDLNDLQLTKYETR